jgi:hypothetical protein
MLPNFGCNTFGLKDRQGGKTVFWLDCRFIRGLTCRITPVSKMAGGIWQVRILGNWFGKMMMVKYVRDS